MMWNDSSPTRGGTIAATSLLIAAVNVCGAGCAQSPLDETEVSDAAQRLIDAFGCEMSALDGIIADKPPGPAGMARQSDLVVAGVVEAVTTDEAITQQSVLIDVYGTDSDGSPARVTLQLFPAPGVSARSAAKTIRTGADLVAYTSAASAVKWCGSVVNVKDGAEMPVSPFGLIISTGNPKARNELVWPMLRLTSWAPLSETPPDGTQFPSL